jgi:hypothetical protein
MKKTRVWRTSEGLFEMVDNGRRQMQAATGRRISVSSYTEMMEQMWKPFMYIKKYEEKRK